MKKFLFAAMVLISGMANAITQQDYTDAVFDQLMADGKPVLIDIFAPWCGTCKKQGKVIAKYVAANQSSDLTILKVNYDEQKDIVRKFKAPRQSTLVAYKDGAEVGRLIAETNQKKIAALIDKTQ